MYVMFMNKILIIEDDKVVRDELGLLLGNNGYAVCKLEDFNEPLKNVLKNNPNLILLDINLPNTDGFKICKEIRSLVKTPIMFVTSRNSDLDELKSITLGGDDFITKPYNTSILLARISSLLKRSNPDYNREIIVKDVILDTHLSVIRYLDKETELTKNEFKILYYLFINSGKVVSKDDIVNYLWTNKLYVDENILNVNITRLRKKLLEIGVQDFIKTVHGKGYEI